MESLNKFGKLLPLNVLLNSYICVNINFENFLTYIGNANRKIIEEYFSKNKITDENEQFNLIFSFALMYKNSTLQKFYYEIIKKIYPGMSLSEPDFQDNFINMINSDVTSIQTGGMSMKEILNSLKIIGTIGLIIAIFCYDVFMVVNTQSLMNETAEKLGDITRLASRFNECTPHIPTPIEDFLIFGAKDPSLMKSTFDAINCFIKNPEFTSTLTKPIFEKAKKNALEVFRGNLQSIEGIEEFKKLLPSPPINEKGVVLYEKSNDNDYKLDFFKKNVEAMEYLVVKKEPDGNIDITETQILVDFLSKKTPEEFKKYLELQTIEKLPEPSLLQTEAPTYSKMVDLVGVGAALLTQVASGANLEVKYHFTLSDTISRNFQQLIISYDRQFKDAQTNAERVSQDYLRDIGYLIKDWETLLKKVPELIYLNTWLFTAITFLASWWFGKKPNSGPVHPQIEDDMDKLTNDFGNIKPLEGGRRRKRNTIRKYKRRTQRHKRGGIRRQTRRKNARRITKKR